MIGFDDHVPVFRPRPSEALLRGIRLAKRSSTKRRHTHSTVSTHPRLSRWPAELFLSFGIISLYECKDWADAILGSATGGDCRGRSAPARRTSQRTRRCVFRCLFLLYGGRGRASGVVFLVVVVFF